MRSLTDFNEHYHQDFLEAVEDLLPRDPAFAARLLLDGRGGLSSNDAVQRRIEGAARQAASELNVAGDGRSAVESLSDWRDRSPPPDHRLPRGVCQFPLVVVTREGPNECQIRPICLNITHRDRGHDAAPIVRSDLIDVASQVYGALEGADELDSLPIAFQYLVFPREAPGTARFRADLSSLELAVLLALVSSLTGWRMRTHLSATGRVEAARRDEALSYSIGTVGELKTKIESVDSWAGSRSLREARLLVPDQEIAAGCVNGGRAVKVKTVEDALARAGYPVNERPSPPRLGGTSVASGLAVAVFFTVMYAQRAVVPYSTARTASAIAWVVVSYLPMAALVLASLALARHATTFRRRVALFLLGGAVGLAAGFLCSYAAFSPYGGVVWSGDDPTLGASNHPALEAGKNGCWFWAFVLVFFVNPVARFHECGGWLAIFRPLRAWAALGARISNVAFTPVVVPALFCALAVGMNIYGVYYWADQAPHNPFWKLHVYSQTLLLVCGAVVAFSWLILTQRRIARRIRASVHPSVFRARTAAASTGPACSGVGS